MSTQLNAARHLSIFIVDARRVIPSNALCFEIANKIEAGETPAAAGDNVGIAFRQRL